MSFNFKGSRPPPQGIPAPAPAPGADGACLGGGIFRFPRRADGSMLGAVAGLGSVVISAFVLLVVVFLTLIVA